MDIHFLIKLTRGLAKVILILCIGLFVLSIVAKSSGIYFNTTPSLPLGFYKIVDESIQKGAHVAFCPPQTEAFDHALARGYIGRGNCPGGYSLLLKRVLAMAGDTVSIDQAGIVVNGEHLSNSAQLKADANHQPLPLYRFEGVLNDAEYLLLSDAHPQSFDVRYFGPINHNQIKHVVQPFLTWNATH